MNRTVKKFLSLTFAILLILMQTGVLAIAESGGDANVDASDFVAELNDSDEIAQTDEPAEQSHTNSKASEIITDFAKLDPDVEVQIITTRDDKSLLNFPSTLDVEINNIWTTISEITWNCDYFNPEDTGVYYFAPDMPDRYILSDYANLPQIIVKVNGINSFEISLTDTNKVTKENPIEISTAEQLAELANLVNAGTLENVYDIDEFHISLIADIDLSEYGSNGGWKPIGNDTNPFRGVFDGKGHVVTGLYINGTSSGGHGLFGRVSSGGIIKNLGVINAEIDGANAGIIAGIIESGTIENCYSTGNVYSVYSNIGGIVGIMQSSNGMTRMINCYSEANVTGWNNVGGIIGNADASGGNGDVNIQNCYSTGKINGSSFVAGIAGWITGGVNVTNCAALNQEIKSNGNAGKITGNTYGSYDNNFAYLNMALNRINNGIDGNEKTADQINSLGFFESLFQNDINWKYASGILPRLSILNTQNLINGQGNGQLWFNPPFVEVTDINLNESNITIQAGKIYSLEAAIEPTDATNKNVTWISSNDEIATVNDDGEVSAISTGLAIITITTDDGSKTASCEVNVVDVPNAPENITAIPGNGIVILNWIAPNNNGSLITKYQVSSDNGDNWIDGTTDTEFTVTGLTNGTDYNFIVRAVNSIGEGRPSASITTTPVKTITINGIDGIATPSTGDTPVTAIAETDEFTGSVEWQQDLSGSNTFKKNTVYTALITISPKLGYTINGITANFFTINGSTAENAENSGVISYTFEVTDNPLPIPADSGKITTSNVTQDSLTLSWSKATDVVCAQNQLKYYVYQSENDNLSDLESINSNGTLLNSGGSIDIDVFNVKNLTENKTYYFNIVVEDEIGNKAAYQAISETTGDKLSQDNFIVRGVDFTDTLIYGDIGKSVTVSGGSGNGEITYVSDNESVLSVNPSNGSLAVHKSGKATITATKSGDGVYKNATSSVVITVNKKSVTLTNVMLAPKTYDGSKTGQVVGVEIDGIITGDSMTLNQDFSAIAEFDNANAGNRNATITVTFNDTDTAGNYTFGENNTYQLINQIISKATGGAVSVPVVYGSPTQTSITVDHVIDISDTKQIIEYAISQTRGTIPLSGWQTDTTFTNLTPDTAYCIYARTQENENYNAGEAKQSSAILTMEIAPSTHTISFNIINGSGNLTAMVDSTNIMSGDSVVDGKNVILTAFPDANYKVREWTDNGNIVNRINSTYTITDISTNHIVTVEFEAESYMVTINSEGINPLGTGNYSVGSVVYISAGAPSINRQFKKWITSSNGVTFTSANISETSFIMPPNDVNVIAEFEDILPSVSGVTVIQAL